MLQREKTADLIAKVGEKVRVSGWVQSIRNHGKVVFLDLRDSSGVLQCVGTVLEQKIGLEDVITIEGLVKPRPKNMINPEILTGTIELQIEKITILEKSAPLPFDMGANELAVSLPVLLDYRSLTLRHPKIKAIFKVENQIINTFRRVMSGLGFEEFYAPTFVASATEGGSNVFPVKYFEHNAYMAQSPQLYKQIMLGVFERVFSVARAYRAEPSVTTRHLCEYISLDAEMGFIDSWKDILVVLEKLFFEIFLDLNKFCSPELALYNQATPQVAKTIPYLKMREAQQIIFESTGVDHRKEPDLDPEDEREICRWARETHKSDLVFITHYPTKKRAFYTMPDPENPEFSLSFDLLGRGLEWVSGSQRINNYNQLLQAIKDRGNKEKDFELYLMAFKYGIPPEGGFALGAERIAMQVLGLNNIREASLFPRDMERIDVGLSKLNPQTK
ncbi:aspartate--tRNA(Asn) ligase [Candidatus Parcubacteria bacterium]|nr:aspartate--tRNA(Asn) ligase [Patescibacteria group bacterium]MCG2689077.1 aspartate--tRNA(Asn) ligase [Candidatus Parcubacteria bacterium]